MSEQERVVLEHEQDVNTAYLANLERRSAGYQIDDRVHWRPRITMGPLIGRVRMRYDGDAADEEFYVAETAADLDGTEVISWAAPAAAAYYGKRFGAESGLRIRRRFAKGAGHAIEAYADEWVVPADGPAFSTPVAPASERVATEPAVSDHTAPESPSPAVAVQDALPDVVPGTEQELRKPRTSLRALLRTLQPEQYDLVAASPTKPLTIQGYAGTGKTVVATHRAAWLTHTDREQPLRNVALIGPTTTWGRHIRPVIDELATPGTVTITSLPEVMRTIIGAPERNASSDDFIDAYSAPLGTTLAKLVTKQRKADPGLTPQRAYEVFLRTNEVSIPVSRRTEFLQWRRTLPLSYEAALGDRKLWPLLTYLSVLLEPQATYDHVIIDEAQDLRPLEWLILAHLNSGTWTLVGDVHQRRTSHATRGWKEIRKLLGLPTGEEESLLGGYRTTRAIIDFAGCLLTGTKGHRAYDVLGEGEPPLILNAMQLDRELVELAIAEAARLSAAHPKGKVAVITPQVRPVGSYAKRHGWSEGEDHYWSGPDGRRFTLLTSEEARGLEFDAVVVVEPSDFKAMPGDNGPLYTALTRANLELVIVHERVLPPAIVRHLRKTAKR
ncbi:Part of AAA domain-containing protein [Raineyella antarctica]|uniref:Part of AAA domain-containing protein n=1 Tax=Raineyella antarctica TaxID=1577474 RepID=A0A1G6GHU8_9ACTN|nr:AAA family ATPase [Raineyella antarctica]SDB81469.1 Part of AAA domain-containing protein [Raineyella antarctica]